MVASNTYGHQIVATPTNKSGGGVILGDVVILDGANNEAFTTTTSASSTAVVGIAMETIANNAVGRVLLHGYASLVNVNASVTRGHYGITHTVAKQATDGGASRTTGTFCFFMTGGTTPTAWVFNPDLGGASLTNPMNAKGQMIIGDTGGTPSALAAGTTAYLLQAAGTGNFPAWAPILSLTEATLSGDVSMTTANTAYDGPTNTPAAGTYDVTGYISVANGVNTVITTVVGRILYGASVVDERQIQINVPSDNGYPTIVPVAARITADGATAIKLQAVCDRASATMKRDPFSNSSGIHRSTLMRLVRVA